MSHTDPHAGEPPFIVIDARGLEPPQPMERVLAGLDELPRGKRLLMRIHIQPRPLFRMLDLNNFEYRGVPAPEGHFEVTIWHKM